MFGRHRAANPDNAWPDTNPKRKRVRGNDLASLARRARDRHTVAIHQSKQRQ